MATTWRMLELNCICFILILAASQSLGANHGNKQLYIVYMGSLPGGSYSPTTHHLDILQSVVTDSSDAHQALYQSYHRSFNGFAAWLTEQERKKLSGMEEVLSLFPSHTLQLQTTRSWDFMGFTEKTVENSSTAQSDVIIGVIDTGIWPESESFNDAGLGPIPEKWKGVCKGGLNFTCNRKIVGARAYGDVKSARDPIGHGTHTASIAAGNKVEGVSFDGLAGGTARGGVPSSRIAVYQVCAFSLCQAANILAAFDDAIADGVDVISISLGNIGSIYVTIDPITIGSFHAMTSNILTINAGGNNGPYRNSMGSVAPWTVSVGASTIDRKLAGKVVLGDGRTVTGLSINSFTMEDKPEYPLIYGRKFKSSCTDELINFCFTDCLDKDFLKGKILMCEGMPSNRSSIDLQIGASGLIVKTKGNYTSPFMGPLPALPLIPSTFDQVAKYANTTEEPRATILKSEDVKDDLAPIVAPFSSRGPSFHFPEIMKPDVVAPGVEILAAYPPNIPPSNFGQLDKRRVNYSILTGTSLSSSHVAGAIAYIKSQHPDWSSAALKSALMTTARPLNASLHPDREFAYGSGHIDPVKAVNPGLIFNISKEDYTNFICSTYGNSACKRISGVDCQCPKVGKPVTDFNYPGLVAYINSTRNININFTRVVTNVGLPNSSYKAKVTADPKLKILVTPSALSFKNLNEKESFVVSVTGAVRSNELLSSLLVWDDGTHTVRIPIVVFSFVLS